MRIHHCGAIGVLALLLNGCNSAAGVDVVAPERTTAQPVEQTLVLSGGETARITRLSPGVTGGSMLTTTPGVEPYACDAFGAWVADWKDAFTGVTTYREAAYLHQRAAPLVVYPGAHIADGSNTNSLTYIGACNGDYDDLSVTIERRVNGVWNPIVSITLHIYERFIFQSGIPAQYRGRTVGAFGATVEHYGVGAAWNISRTVKRAP